jgi:hypothetical protein
MAMLELSCDEDVSKATTNGENKEHPYLTKSALESQATTVETRDPSELIKEMFAKLVTEGFEPNAAAAKAIQMVAEQRNAPKTTTSFDPGPLNGIAWKSMNSIDIPSTEELALSVVSWNNSGKTVVHTVVSTAQKYLENVIREPWTPRFRSFKLSNKVVDHITRVEGALELICSLGLYIYPTETDFLACIPLSADLDQLKEAMSGLLSRFSQD